MGKFLERISLGALKNSVPDFPAVVQTQASAAARDSIRFTGKRPENVSVQV